MRVNSGEALPIAFRLRAVYATEPDSSALARKPGLNYPEQWFFFVPVVLLAFLIAIRMNPGMVTLSWGVEAVLMILLGLGVKQRSYRISGLLLLVLCVAKIVLPMPGGSTSATATSPSSLSAQRSLWFRRCITAIAKPCGGCCEADSRPRRHPAGRRCIAVVRPASAPA